MHLRASRQWHPVAERQFAHGSQSRGTDIRIFEKYSLGTHSVP